MRYQRQIIIPQIGEKGQEKLKKSKVLIVGAGGLGSAAAFYLASSGIGYIGIVDPDIVELSNLQRQILHNEDHLGMPKPISAMITLKKLNKQVNILPYLEEINTRNAEKLIHSYDVVVACPDNFKTRFILNEVCFKKNKPLIIGAASNFEGHVFDIIPPKGPCYSCLFENAQDDKEQVGILAPVAGVIGTLQAVETIKLLLQIGEPLHGKMTIYDGIKGTFREVRFLRDSSCKICE